ncbi:MAG: Gfo/Idh/MocA family protein [Planctomycetota bacterium]|jgi:predicted dehydrogenase
MTVKPTQASEPDDFFSRRRFIAKSAAATAGFAIVRPSAVRGFGANSRIEAGCIGLGGRGRLIAGMLAGHEGFQVTSAADYFPEVVRSAGEKLSVAGKRRYSGLNGYQKLIAGKVDAVFCETPPYCFGEHVTAAVNAGCHVYLAKPVACDVPGSLAVQKAAKKASKNKQVFLVDFQTRTNPFFIEAIKRTQDGLIGETGLLSSFYTDESFPDPPLTGNIESRLQRLIWVNDIALGGGQLVCAGIHAVDVALWVAGTHPISAVGCSRIARHNPHGDSADVYSVTYQFENGLILNHQGEHMRNTHGFQCSCFAFGQHGYLDGIRRNLDTFHNSIVNGIYDNPTVQPSIDSTLATILGRQAAARNTKVTWDEMIAENKKLQVDLTGLRA